MLEYLIRECTRRRKGSEQTQGFVGRSNGKEGWREINILQLVTELQDARASRAKNR